MIDNVHIPEWPVTAFDMKIGNKGNESVLGDELIEMQVKLEVKSLFKSKNLAEYQQYQYSY